MILNICFFFFFYQAPAAFGSVSFLLHENYERNRIRKHLFIFAMAAPVAALITYFGLSHVSILSRIVATICLRDIQGLSALKIIPHPMPFLPLFILTEFFNVFWISGWCSSWNTRLSPMWTRFDPMVLPS